MMPKSKYEAPGVQRALQAFGHALTLTLDRSKHSDYSSAALWHEVVDAWEVAADAGEEAGAQNLVDEANARVHQILDGIRRAYSPIEPQWRKP